MAAAAVQVGAAAPAAAAGASTLVQVKGAGTSLCVQSTWYPWPKEQRVSLGACRNIVDQRWVFERTGKVGHTKFYRFKNQQTGRCLVTKDASTSLGARVVSYPCADRRSLQELTGQWTMTRSGQLRLRGTALCLSTLNAEGPQALDGPTGPSVPETAGWLTSCGVPVASWYITTWELVPVTAPLGT